MIWFSIQTALKRTGEKVLLKTDWFAIVIATLGAGLVVYYGWSLKKENPVVKKLLYTLIVLMIIIWSMCAYLLLGRNG